MMTHSTKKNSSTNKILSLRFLGLFILAGMLMHPAKGPCEKGLSACNSPDFCKKINSLPGGAAGHTMPTILSIGDSIQAYWHNKTSCCKSVPEQAALKLGEYVKMKSISGAHMTYPRMPYHPAGIHNQYKAEKKGPWEWIIINGGANDLFCAGCNKCDYTNNLECRKNCTTALDELADTTKGTGDMYDIIKDIKADHPGIQILILGYYRMAGEFADLCAFLSTPEASTGFKNLNSRYKEIADNDKQVHYLETDSLMTDKSGKIIMANFYADLIHPSIIGSELLGAHIATYIMNYRK